MKNRIIMLAAACGLCRCACAQSLEEREAWIAQEKIVLEAAEPVRKFCGVDLKVTLDQASWNKVRKDWREASPSGRCGEVAERLVDLCRSSTPAKEAVAKGVKQLFCAYGGATTGFRFELKGGRIEYWVEAERPNMSDELTRLLKQLL